MELLRAHVTMLRARAILSISIKLEYASTHVSLDINKIRSGSIGLSARLTGKLNYSCPRPVIFYVSLPFTRLQNESVLRALLASCPRGQLASLRGSNLRYRNDFGFDGESGRVWSDVATLARDTPRRRGVALHCPPLRVLSASRESQTLAQLREDDEDPMFGVRSRGQVAILQTIPFPPISFFRTWPIPSPLAMGSESASPAGVLRETCATRAGSACRDRTWVHASRVTQIDDALDGGRSRRARTRHVR
jgi:hypothetical protein